MKLGIEDPNRKEFKNSGFIFCDGIVIDNVKNMLIDYCDDEITLQDKNNYEVGCIYNIEKREVCMFSDYENLNDIAVILNGKVVI